MELGLKQALATFQFASKNVPAYRQILSRSNIAANGITDEEHFKLLPILDKKNYIQAFPSSKLLPYQALPPIAYASSGSSGKPSFWFRNNLQETAATMAHEAIVRDTFHIKKKDPTLVIICFSMGVWVAGNSEAAAFSGLCKLGYALTVVTPGIEKQDIFHVLKNLSPNYKYVILAGYPPFISGILHDCKETGIKVGKNFRILTSGDTFSEHWRDTVMELTGIASPQYILSVYGCADASMIGCETPLSIFIRRQARDNRALSQSVFGSGATEPAFVQYNPNYIYFEQLLNELVLTVNAGIPLVRYNLHDLGHVLNYPAAVEALRNFKLYDKAKKTNLIDWRMPFLVKKGRSDVAVTFYALNLFPENFKTGLEDMRMKKLFTGSFVAYNSEAKNHKTHNLHLALELKPNYRPSKQILEISKNIITENLLKTNIEYHKLFNTIGAKALPIIHLKKFGSVTVPKTGLFYVHGKKPRLIN